MNHVLMILTAALFSFTASAAPLPVLQAAKMVKQESVRTLIKEVENTDGNPCMPEGKSYTIDLQVKEAQYDRNKGEIVYDWKTVKSVVSDANGEVMEVCAE